MLSPAQFAELIATIQTTRDEGAKPGVRRAPRLEHPCRITIAIGTDPTAAPVLVQLKDIAVRGMCFLHNQNIPAGSAFRVTLEAPGGKPVTIDARVVHCRKLDETTFQVGAEFSLAQKPEEPLDYVRTAEDWMQTRPKTFVAVPSSSKKSY